MNICELLENSNSQCDDNEDAVYETDRIEYEPIDRKSELDDDMRAELNSPNQTNTRTNDEEFEQFLNPEKDYDVSSDSSDNTDSSPESNDNSDDFNKGTQNQINSSPLNNPQLNHYLNFSILSSYNSPHEEDQDQDNDNNHSNIDFGHSILSNSGDDEYNFDRLGPFEKLCSLCDNTTPSNMEAASKYLIPALEFCSTQDDFMRVFSYLRKYCFFSDVLLRSLWLEQIQNIIQYIHQEGENIPIEFKDNFNMANELAQLISDLMQEPTYQVKKYATNSTLCLIERQLLNNDQIERSIIPGLLNLVKENNEDFHIDCIQLFGKLAPLIGRELTSKYFLEPFCRLSTSPVFHTRKACASNIIEIANIVSTEEVEQYLIPHFCEFMKDQVWAIRKLCADTFPMFAVKCRRRTREQQLTECFIKLLDDNSRWVKISAYKSLGSFIATFSKENVSEEDDDEDLENVSTEEQPGGSEVVDVQTKEERREVKEAAKEVSSDDKSTEKTARSPKKEDEYSNFIYWRNSIPNLEDPESLAREAKTEKSVAENTKKITATSNLATESKKNPVESTQINSKTLSFGKFGPFGQMANGSAYNIYSSTNTLYSNIHNHSKPIDLLQLTEDLKQQEVVPPILLSYFITMVEMNAQNSLDAEMNYNCAFNFPAIAQTLGLSNWKHVRNLYKKLAEDNNWKVRQTLAYSIHELARILGTECTQAELVPVFDSFIKDVDEVRMGIVSNLHKFFKVLSMDYRKAYMSKLNDFLKMDNQRNWRFRNELGLQIAEFVCLFPADYISEYIQPVTFILALDKVAEVRSTAVKALTLILKEYELNKEDKCRRIFLDDVFRSFANNSKWSFRQLFVILCENIFKEKACLDLEAVSTDLLPKLFSLRNDTVANIRVCLARVISNHILNIEHFNNINSSISQELGVTIECLSKDRETDVRSYFSSGDLSSQQGNSLPPYEDVVNYSNSSKQATSSQQVNAMSASNLNNESSGVFEVQTTNCHRLNDSLNLISGQVMNYDNSDDVELEEDDDDDDDDDEIIDTTKVCQLKIVNELDNDMEDDSDEVIDKTPHSPGPIPMKIDESVDWPSTNSSSTLGIDFPNPVKDASITNKTRDSNAENTSS